MSWIEALIGKAQAATGRGPAPKTKAQPQKPSFTSVFSNQLPAGAFMKETGRVIGVDSEQVGRLGGYMDEMGRVFLPANNKVTPSSWGAAPTAPAAPVQGQTFAGSSPAIERAYQQEKSRVAQLAAQDELAKKYQVADLTKAYNAASGEEKEKIGLQIWATTNPQLAAKLKPGQLGYQETQAVAASQSPLGEAMKAVGNMQYTDKISFGAVPATDFGVGLNTPLTGVQIPSIPQVGIAETFQGATPGGISFTEAAELFKGQLPGQADAATLKRLFEQGLKK